MRFVFLKGRFLKFSIEFLRKVGVELEFLNGREFVLVDGRVFFVRVFDVFVYVEYGVEVGIVGSDVVLERGSDVFIFLELFFGKCRISVVVFGERKRYFEDMDCFRIVMKYLWIVSFYFDLIGVDVEVMKFYGSVEFFVRMGIVDVIVDIVEIG